MKVSYFDKVWIKFNVILMRKKEVCQKYLNFNKLLSSTRNIRENTKIDFICQ